MNTASVMLSMVEGYADLELCVRRGGPSGRFRLSYTSEAPGDRDLRDVLWDRDAPAGQRDRMLYLDCAMCGQPVRQIRSIRKPRLGPGLLFLVPGGEDLERTVRTVLPPVCLAHTPAAVRQSMAFQHDHAALLVSEHRLYGVIGTPYRWAGHYVQPLPPSDDPVAYGSFEARWRLARLLVRELTEYTVVDHADLTEAR
ncbi:hypothetical protein ACGH2B_24840 [Streptomyces sp. BBFR2]|uniref:hypothetical protein n=1 Tax=Streptomyces sp. BBFR2 TaxID=3372854 RepID=UPI0037DA76FE